MMAPLKKKKMTRKKCPWNPIWNPCVEPLKTLLCCYQSLYIYIDVCIYIYIHIFTSQTHTGEVIVGFYQDYTTLYRSSNDGSPPPAQWVAALKYVRYRNISFRNDFTLYKKKKIVAIYAYLRSAMIIDVAIYRGGHHAPLTEYKLENRAG